MSKPSEAEGEALPAKRKIGRPTKYAGKTTCDAAIEMMAEGRSEDDCADALGVDFSTWWVWKRDRPEFHKAVEMGRRKSQVWWERHARENLTAKHFQTGLWAINMVNRFGWVSGNNASRVTHEGEVQVTHEHQHRLIRDRIAGSLAAVGDATIPAARRLRSVDAIPVPGNDG